jgi:hypothetical protein
MKYDELITCPKSGGNACLRTQVTPDVSTFLSFSCGFWTNSLMKEGEEFYNTQMETIPELHKDLAWVDESTGLTWLPNVINEQGKGMVFADGTSKENWGWAAVKSIEIPEEERKNHPIPGKPDQYLKYRMDMENIKHFPENDYIEALDYINIFNQELLEK